MAIVLMIDNFGCKPVMTYLYGVMTDLHGDVTYFYALHSYAMTYLEGITT